MFLRFLFFQDFVLAGSMLLMLTQWPSLCLHSRPADLTEACWSFRISPRSYKGERPREDVLCLRGVWEESSEEKDTVWWDGVGRWCVAFLPFWFNIAHCNSPSPIPQKQILACEDMVFNLVKHYRKWSRAVIRAGGHTAWHEADSICAKCLTPSG